MSPQVSEIPREWLEGIHSTRCINAHACEKGVKAYVRPNVIHNSPWPKRVPELNLFVVFIASKPATMIARTDNPLFPAQGFLKDRHNGGVRYQPERKTESSVKQALIRYARQIKRVCASQLGLSYTSFLQGIAVLSYRDCCARVAEWHTQRT